MSESSTPHDLVDVEAAVPSDEDRARRRRDLLGRVQLVADSGWADVRSTWSSGEVAGVALVLDDYQLVTEVVGSEAAALDTWAATLWGITGGEADAQASHPRTRAWFAAIRSDVAAGRAGAAPAALGE